MALFGRQRRPEPSDELADLRYSIQNRGQAKIPEAAQYVSDYLDGITIAAGVQGQIDASAWLRDRLRMLMVVSWANWFGVLDRVPEGAALRPEWVMLTTEAGRFGPEHLVAWWWHLSEPLFRPLVANQLDEMRGALVDGARDLQQRGGDYRNEMVDWVNFFK